MADDKQKRMSPDRSLSGDSDLDYKPEVERQEEGNQENLIAKLLQGGLAKSIQEIVARETAKALEQAKGVGVQAGASGEFSHKGVTGGGETDRQEPAGSTSCSGGTRTRAGAEILEPFDPDNKDCNVERWLRKIDQLGRIHGWSEYEQAYFMQAKLQGAARTWYNRLDRYDQTWGEWKKAIAEAFPRQHDYAELLYEMLMRVKLEGESMNHYYHDKMSKLDRCEITGEKAVSCVIKGLPTELQGNARAFKCRSPGELYTGFLSSFERYDQQTGDKRRNTGGQGSSATHKIMKRQEIKTEETGVRCYNCQQIGDHLSKNCPKPRAERCIRCKRPGHDHRSCPDRRPGGQKAAGSIGGGNRSTKGRGGRM